MNRRDDEKEAKGMTEIWDEIERGAARANRLKEGEPMDSQWNRIKEKARKLKGVLPFPVPERESSLPDTFEDWLDVQLRKLTETRNRKALEAIGHVEDDLFMWMENGDRHTLESIQYPNKRLVVRMDERGVDANPKMTFTKQEDGSYKRTA